MRIVKKKMRTLNTTRTEKKISDDDSNRKSVIMTRSQVC
jgi:hypothetical protein